MIRILNENPLAGKAGWENDLSTYPVDLTNNYITEKLSKQKLRYKWVTMER
jgi:hypothetical protein